MFVPILMDEQLQAFLCKKQQQQQQQQPKPVGGSGGNPLCVKGWDGKTEDLFFHGPESLTFLLSHPVSEKFASLCLGLCLLLRFAA